MRVNLLLFCNIIYYIIVYNVQMILFKINKIPYSFYFSKLRSLHIFTLTNYQVNINMNLFNELFNR